MNTRSLLVRLTAVFTLACALTLGNVGAQITTFNDATNDISASLGTTGDGTLDIVKMDVVDTETDVVFTMTVNGNVNNTGWGNFMVGIANQKTNGSTIGNGWGRPINLNAGITNGVTNGMTHWIGSWIGGSQLWTYSPGGGGGTGGNWSGPSTFAAYATAAGSQSTLTYTVSKASLGVTNGDTIIFDAYSSGGGGGDSAVDALANTNVSITGWSQNYTSTATNLTRSYTLANTALNTTQDITFSVNMNTQTAIGNFNPATDAVSVEYGTGFAQFAYLTDTDNDGIYSGVVSVSAPANTPVGYRYVNEPGNTSLPLVRETVSRSFTMPTSALVITPTPYFDNIEGYRDVTFSVNMSVQTTLGTFVPGSNVVEIRGPFNGWSSSTAWQLSDSDADGIYTGTFRFGGTSGQSIEYKYYASGTAGYESVSNRSFNLAFNVGGSPTPAEVLTTVYFNNQSTVPQNRNVTFSVNMNFQISSGAFVPATGVVDVRGTINGWSGGSAWQLTDIDADGIYTGTFNIVGTDGNAEEYKFWATGPGWESVPNRTFNLGTTGVAQVLPTVYYNNNSGQTRDVTFSVDMSVQQANGLFDPATGTVELRGIGSFNAADAKTLTRVGTTLVYEGTYAVGGDSGTEFSYKFYSSGVTAGGYEIINPNDLFQNRTATLGASGTPQVLPLAYFSNQLFYTTGAAPNPFSTTQGIASAAQSVTINGQGLTADIVATAPTGYEVSADGITYGTTANLVPASGAVTGTNNLFVRIAASAAAGSPSGNVSLTSTGSQSVSIAVSGTVTASGQTFAGWSGGLSTTPTLQLQYAIGGASGPTATNGLPSVTTVTSNALAITAIVRTNDPNLSVVGQAVIDLSAGFWSTNDVTMTPGDQSGVGEGLQKQIWSVPRASDTKKFLRLQTVLTNQ